MAETFATLKTKLADWLNIQTTKRLSEAQRGTMLNMACRALLRDNELSFGEASDEISILVNQWDYTLPVRFVKVHSIYYVDSDDNIQVFDKLSREEFVEKYPSESASTPAAPEDFCIWGRTLYLGPTPDEAITAAIDYWEYYADLSADDDSNALTDHCWEAVLFKALVFTSQYMIEDLRVPMWEAAAKEFEDRLIQEYRREKSAGRRPVSKIPG